LAKADPQQLALQALSRALADPAAKVLYGSRKQPGIFASGAKAAKTAAQFCLDHGWLEPTDQFEGKGRSRKELYRLTPAGAQEALENSEPVTLLRGAADSLKQNAEQLETIKSRVQETLTSLRRQMDNVSGLKELVAKIQDRLLPPDLARLESSLQRAGSGPVPPGSSLADWLQGTLEYLADYQQRHPYGHCPLPELFHQVGAPAGLSIGQFHDGLRRLVAQGKIRLHAFTGAAYQLQEEQFALVAGQEIKYYAERLGGS
jgi:hypothetical protein